MMQMFFDLHTDILYDIVQKRLDQKKNIIKDHHLKELNDGGFMGGIWCYYTDLEPLCEFNQALDFILEELETCKDVVNIVTSKDQFSNHKLNVVLGLESIKPIKDLNEFKQVYDLGFRHAMLTWNETNHFATGVSGDTNRGLTKEGEAIIDFMTNNGMILDVSHANLKTFWDIVKQTDSPLLASHSNRYRLTPHKRNLQDDQVNAIINTGGLIGLTAVTPFLTDEKKAYINDLMKHFNTYKEDQLLDHIGFGFDFMYYLDAKNLVDLKTPRDTVHLIQHFNTLTPQEIQKVSYENALKFIKMVIPR
jgi:membrane dipeptidase